MEQRSTDPLGNSKRSLPPFQKRTSPITHHETAKRHTESPRQRIRSRAGPSCGPTSNRIRPAKRGSPRPVLHGLPLRPAPRAGNFARPTAACQRGSSRTVTRSRPWSTSLPLDKTTGTKWRGTRTPAAVTRAPAPPSSQRVRVQSPRRGDDPEHEQPWSTRRAARPVLSTPAG